MWFAGELAEADAHIVNVVLSIAEIDIVSLELCATSLLPVTNKYTSVRNEIGVLIVASPE